MQLLNYYKLLMKVSYSILLKFVKFLGDYLKYQDLNAELLRSDLEVIYETEVTIVRNKHVTKALNSQVTSVDMTLGFFLVYFLW